jgi:glucose 1-dehydrogenase
MSLQGKTALVTGADSGIGQAIATALADAGADIAVHYGTDRQGAETTAEAIHRQGRKATILQADLGEPRQAQPLFQQALQALGQVDILVNCAGTSSPQGGALQEPLDDFIHLLNVDLVSPFALCQAAGQHMAGRGSGNIVNISSVSQWIVDPQSTAYHAAKGGLKNLTESFALELAPKGVRVNSVAPGLVATPMTAEKLKDPQQAEQSRKRIPLQRIGQPQDIANVVLFLVSDQASFITGVSYPVDGGTMLSGAV